LADAVASADVEVPVALGEQVDAALGDHLLSEVRVLERSRRDKPLVRRVQRFDVQPEGFNHAGRILAAPQKRALALQRRPFRSPVAGAAVSYNR
jgi:hypothetical protein